MSAEDVIQREWGAALEDLQRVADGLGALRAEHFRLFLRDGERPQNSRLAVWYAPYIEPGEDDVLDGYLVARLSAPGAVERHRIVIWASLVLGGALHEAALAGRIRHELEHARQWTLGGGSKFFVLDALANSVITARAGGRLHGVLYNAKPAELDANAAAADYLRRRYPEQVEPLLAWEQGEDATANLVRSAFPPEPPETLMARTVMFMFQFREVCEAELLGGGDSFEQQLGVISSDEMRDLWLSLRTLVDEMPPPEPMDLDW